MDKCECKLCLRNKKYREWLDLLPEGCKSFAVEIYGLLSGAEFDLDIAHAVIDGSWPSADKQIKEAREAVEKEERDNKVKEILINRGDK